jgi:hypothetical protein
MTQAALLSTQADAGSAVAWPAVSLAQSQALLTAPGAMFEMEPWVRDGLTVRAWKNGPKSLVEMFLAACAFGERTFIVNGAERISFDAFARAAMAFAHHLIGAGVKPGDRVAIAMRNLPEWPVAFYGAALAGAVATPLNAWWSANELAYGLVDSGAKVAVFDGERYDRARERLPGARLSTSKAFWARPRPGHAFRRSVRRRSRSAPSRTPPCSTPRARRVSPRAWPPVTAPSRRPCWPPSTPRRAASCAGARPCPRPTPPCRNAMWWPSPSSTSPAASRC